MAASVTMQSLSCPSSVARSGFLTGAKYPSLTRNVQMAGFAAAPSSFSKVLKIEASKGEWLPGLNSPAYLDGSLPGDNGFDPLGLGEDPAALRWYVQAELQNGRWAMLGVAGILLPEVFTKLHFLNVPLWFDAGAKQYFAPASTLFTIEFILFHYVEIRRWQDIKYPGSVNQDPFFKQYKLPDGEVGYPGGIFNPLKFPANEEYKEKEIANGRLAMLAFLGFLVQYYVTGKGPYQNLLDHLADPWHTTILETFGFH